jgi:predicted PurR-regulated permease PerM
LAANAAAAVVYSVRELLLRVLVALFLAVSLDPAVRWLPTFRSRVPGLPMSH